MALRVASSSMNALKFKIEVTANNLSNCNTSGFKKSKVDFGDIISENSKVGSGTRVTGTSILSAQGSQKLTDNPMDLAINGQGFFRFLDPITNQQVYTRNGAIKQDDQGRFTNAQGFVLDPAITLTVDQLYSHISEDGRVWAKQQGSGVLNQVGQIQLYNFPNPAGLYAMGNSNYTVTSASGAEIGANPKSQGLGSLTTGTLESSNVQVVSEMVDLLTAQKSFDTNQKVIQAEDKMASLADLIR